MSTMDWDKAQQHIDSTREFAAEAAKMPNCDMRFYMMGLEQMQRRIAGGERTQELYDEIMEMS